MSGFEINLIDSIKDLGGTDWKGIFVSLFINILSLCATFKIAKYQIDTQLKNQNDLEVKKENRLLVTNIRLNKHEAFYETLTEYLRLIKDLEPILIDYTYSVKTRDQLREDDSKLKAEIAQKYSKIEMFFVYFPNIKEDCLKLDLLYKKLRYIIDIDFIGCKNKNLINAGKSMVNFLDTLNLINSQGTILCSKLTSEMAKKLNTLENEL